MTAPCPVFGFAVELEMRPGAGASAKAFVTEFQNQILDSRGLVAERTSPWQLTFIVRSEASQATDADARAVEAWARTRSEILRARVGPIVDLRGMGNGE